MIKERNTDKNVNVSLKTTQIMGIITHPILGPNAEKAKSPRKQPTTREWSKLQTPYSDREIDRRP